MAHLLRKDDKNMAKGTALRVVFAILVCSVVVSAADCMTECNQRFKDKVAICDKLFESTGSAYYHDTAWHKTCLDNARTEFDTCKSMCK
jgi:hypothetical protein